MRRRDFIKVIAGSAACWPLAARAQSKPMARLGVLLYSNPQSDPQMPSIRQGLSELGYVEGRNITIESRYAEGRVDRLPILAAELVVLQPDVMLAIGGDVAQIAKKFNETIPLVFLSSADPQQLGLVSEFPSTRRQRDWRYAAAGRTRVQASRALEGGCTANLPGRIPLESGSPG
jgi:putative ABC transport system substrate-binding protein